MAKIKISRKKLLQEPDEFLSASQKTWLWVHENQKRAGAIAGAIVGVLVIAVLAKSLIQGSREKRAAAVGAAVERYVASRSAAAPPADVAKELADLAAKHGSSHEGTIVRYFQGGTLAAQGDTAKAAELFGGIAKDPKAGDLATLSKVALAYLDLARGDADAALAAFEALLADSGAAVPRAQIQMEVGAILERKGRLADARRTFQAVAEAHAEGTFGELAKARLAALAEREKSAS